MQRVESAGAGERMARGVLDMIEDSRELKLCPPEL
jgi:hypothetical protein